MTTQVCGQYFSPQKNVTTKDQLNLEDGKITIKITEVTETLFKKFASKIFRMKKTPEMRNFTNVFNTSYLIDSYIVFTLEIESVYKITIFGLKMMVKSGQLSLTS